MSEKQKEETRKAESDNNIREACARISPRMSRRDWMPDECRVFEEWDAGAGGDE